MTGSTISTQDRARGSLLGLACGDAVGTTVEFVPRGSFRPVTDMVGGGPFELRPGQWTDDTSMALCLAESLLKCDGFNPADQMLRYLRWFREGYLSSNGECFDIGNTVHRSLIEFERTGEPFSGPTDPRSAGNGSIMRLAPVVLLAFPDREAASIYAAQSSRTTHGAPEAVEACGILAGILSALLAGERKEAAVSSVVPTDSMSASLRDITSGIYRQKVEDEIRGSGYVVESLEAALWCFYQSDDFEEAVLRAANLGDDADTTAAVCGQLAGALWGESGIPGPWLERLAMAARIRSMADDLLAAAI